MRELRWILPVVICLGLFVFLLVYFNTQSSTIILEEEVSKSTMVMLYKAAPEDRIWFMDAGLLPGSDLVYITYNTRTWDRDKLWAFLDELEVEYEIVGKGNER